MPNNLIGSAPEILCKINDIDTLALIDSGSQISSVCMSHYNNHFSDKPLQDLSALLNVQSAGGNDLPYHGYFECNISIPVSDTSNFNISAPILVVPDTAYNSKVPLLIGTNILNRLSNFPEKPKSAHLHTAIQAINLGSKHLAKTQGIFGQIVATDDITVQPFTGSFFYGKSTIAIPICNQVALVQENSDQIPVVPSLVNVKQGCNKIPLELFNNSDSTLHISKNQLIGNVHQATVEIPDDSDMTEFLDAFPLSHLSDEDRNSVRSFLSEYRDLFAMNLQELGTTDVVEHRIDLYDDTPFKEKIRPIPPGMYEELKSHIAELISAGVIRKSNSPYSSNIVLVRKSDGNLRLCQDMRRLNNLTIPDAYTIPRVETLIDSLKGARYFTSLDLISGYHQVRIFDDHIQRTAFSTPFGLYECEKMAMGLKNSQSTFQRLMDCCLDGLLYNGCNVYLDDILVYGSTKQEMFDNLKAVFERLRKFQLRLKPKKCKILCPEISFLGFTVSEEGVKCSSKHIQDVQNWPEPKNVHDLQVFLGLANFLRKFVHNFASIVAPLTNLLRGHTNKKRSKTKKCKSNSDPAPWEWGENQRKAFENIKHALTSPPCLAYPDFEQPFILHCDGSGVGLGCALYQKDEKSGKLHPIAFGSRSLSQSEQRYSAHKLEFLALKWAVTNKFSYYLYNSKHPVQIYTDHNPLVYLTTTAKLDALGHRWLAELSSYNFEIHYKPGVSHKDADSLSRKPADDEQYPYHISTEVFKELCRLLGSSDFDGIAESANIMPSVCNTIHVNSAYSPDWQTEQQKDPTLKRVINLVSRGIRLSDRQRRREPQGVMRLLSHWKRLHLIDEKLYLKSSNQTGEIFHRLVIPDHMRDTVFRMIHDDMGHLGRDKTLSLAQERFFWVNLTGFVEDKIRSCYRCQCAKSLPERAPLVSITTTQPLELVCIDFLSLEESKGKYTSLLVVTDHFTGYAQAYPTRNQRASTVAKILIDDFIKHYGLMQRLHSDQGGSFEATVIKHICKSLGIQKSHTTPYHAMGDGKTERFNRSLLSMLRTLQPAQKANWKDHVSAMVHAYNCCKHASTGVSPYFLMFGRSPRIAVDIFLGITENENNHSAASDIRARLENAYKAASEAADNARATQSKNYNKKVRGNSLSVGDYVLVKNVHFEGKHKLADKWNSDLHIVIEKPNEDIPVFKVRAESTGKVKTLHRNLLLPAVLPWPKERLDESNVHSDLSDSECSNDESVSDIEVHLEYYDPMPEPHRDANRTERIESQSDTHVNIDTNAYVDVTDDFERDDESLFHPQPSLQQATPVFRSAPVTPSHPSVQPTLHESTPVVCDGPSILPPLETTSVVSNEPLISQPPGSDSVAPKRVSARSTKGQRPKKYSDYVCQSQTVGNTETTDWQEKVGVLMRLLPIFPMFHGDICHAIIYVISHG